MNIDRRMILGATLAVPAWLSLGFDTARGTTSAPSRLAAAIQRARNVGKPLLVLLVPLEVADAVRRGEMWGTYLSLLTDDQALDLALCEVTCARASDLESAVPRGVAGIDATTWAVLLETAADPVTSVLVRGELPPLPEDVTARGASAPRWKALAQMLRKAIVPDEAAQQRRLAQSVPVLPEGKHIGLVEAEDPFGQLECTGGTGPVQRAALDRWAAHVRFDPGATRDRQALLADAARLRVFENAPEGAKWMTYSSYCPPCGMGAVPPNSRYFLKFLVQ